MGTIAVKRIENSLFSSNTFVIYAENYRNAWLVDCGDFERVENWLIANQKTLCGIFVTHCHFDHIYGINKALEYYPDLKIYASQMAFEGMRNSKINGSLYAENAFVVNSANNVILNDINTIDLDGLGELTFFESVGHSPDSCCFKIGNFLFTGDAFIPNIRTVSKLRGGNREKAKETVLYLYEKYSENIFVCPGHTGICEMKDVCVDKMI